jgi:hypothetical protein
VAHLPGFGKVLLGLKGISISILIRQVSLTNLFVILFQEVDDSDVVFERHLMCLWKGIERWHVASICLNCLQDIFRQADRVQFEVRLEQQIYDVVDAPFP